MPEATPYPGSPSLSADAREKVLQTFRHTLNLAQNGRNEEALLGCDFILKMDARFAPARRLLDALRGIASGTIVDLGGFAEFLSAAAPAPQPAPAPRAPAPAPRAPAPAPAPAFTPVHAPVPSAPSAPPPAASMGGLDDLSLDDLGMGPPPAASAPRPAAPPAFSAPSFSVPEAPAAPSFSLHEEPAPAPAPAAAAPSLDGLGFGDVPDLPPLGGPSFGAPAPDPFAAPGGLSGADPFAIPGAEPPVASPAPAPGRPSPGPSGAFPAPARTGAVDPRIVQFLKQGDDAMARGNVQEAIDLWSRVFLIDLSNEDASQRIDRAREAQADNARKVDTLVSEGIQLYDSGDLTGARHKFLDVLAISEGDATARSYLNQIDASLATGAPAGETPQPVLSDFGADDMGSGARDYAAEAPMADMVQPEAEPEEDRERAEGAAPVRRTVDVRLLLLGAVVALAVVGGGTWWFLRGRSRPAPPPPNAGGPRRPGGAPGTASPAGQHPVDEAQNLFDQGKVEEAQNVARSVPATDPRYAEALALIEKIKTSAPPPPTPVGQTQASLDELRAEGMAAAKASRYIDAVQKLTPVVKARPEDAEAAQELARSRDQVSQMASAVKSFNEQDYESAIKLLWALRKTDAKNQDVEDYLFRSYFNQGVQSLQAGNTVAAATALQEALQLRPQDAEAQRHLKFAKKYAKGPNDLAARIYIRHVTPRS